MKKFILRFYKSNSELSNFMKATTHLQTVQSRRSSVNIAIIDDQGFDAQLNLQSYGYKVDALGDLKSISEVAKYHIVLCDIIGVGKNFDKNTQGASLISEIKKSYPEKVVIAYTSAMLNERVAKIATLRADETIKKDTEIEDFVEKLDRLSLEAIDPHIIWNKIRERFVQIDVDSRDIILFEDAYVRSVLKKDPGLSILSSRISKMDIGPDVRAILQGLASSAIFSSIFGV